MTDKITGIHPSHVFTAGDGCSSVSIGGSYTSLITLLKDWDQLQANRAKEIDARLDDILAYASELLELHKYISEQVTEIRRLSQNG